ncbi:uncharacterized protein LAESUDRAFT_720453 [Laetiporus sulphureus 93-53]|uniref:Pali-domain-containing protein n=1 Tax=Laetiporus sulphureus 93-53 TaxID=1314785 RepID=A0A165H4U7_9APHY|nr:uncharacterized protein LAESUDRAFT_720453 [Laetiporus sulphureus 93-53]KZT11246.1 hypothetical protein LAESUDRAFT_720453 [Laetiporus sulphureus 93-53]
MLAALTPFFLLDAFLLLLLVSLSVPIINIIYLFHLVGHDTSGFLNADGSAWFGVWGYCVSALDVSVLGYNDSTGASCSKVTLGHDLSPAVLAALKLTGVNLSSGAISRATSAILVLHPIACGFAFIPLVSSLFLLRRRPVPGDRVSRCGGIYTLVGSLFAAVLITIVFLIDVILVAVMRRKVDAGSDGALTLNWGNAVWMTLGATVALWLATAGASAAVCAYGKRYRKATMY